MEKITLVIAEKTQTGKFTQVVNYHTTTLDGCHFWVAGGLLYIKAGFSVKTFAAEDIKEISCPHGVPEELRSWYINNINGNGALYTAEDLCLINANMPPKYTCTRIYTPRL